jgi:hypothetical protein
VGVAGVPGKGGPPPKREGQRRRRNKGAEAEHVQVAGKVDQPEPPDGLLGARGLAYYRSLAESGQAVFYEPSDWQVALVCAQAIDLFMETGRATVLAEVRALQSQLLATEGERRRARLELERDSGEESADVIDADVWRRRLEARESG